MKTVVLVALTFLFSPFAWADPTVTGIGNDLYAYISDNDGSANSTFLVGHKGILVVDTASVVSQSDGTLCAMQGSAGVKAVRRCVAARQPLYSRLFGWP